jgi:predicted dehydrogenase
MDYTTQNLAFRLKKMLRYVRLYGLRRTLVKVKGQYHMKKRYVKLPAVSTPHREGGHVGLIGCGNFAFSNIAYYLRKNYGSVVRGAMDIDIHRAASLYKEYGLRYYTANADEVISDPAVDLVYIASNHASHAEYAIKALRAGKSVHIEKPHAVTMEQLRRLCGTIQHSDKKVNLGFLRPMSRMGQMIKQYLDAESGAAMFNWFVGGHEIPPDHWYFKEEEGGRVLGNLCHWTDFVYQMVPPESRFPITIMPTRWEKFDCDIAVTYVFGDGTIAAITFSAKGHLFEGVSERFTAQKGNALIRLDDFKRLTIDVVEKRRVISPVFRDHGHEANIKRSYEMVRPAVGGFEGWSLGNIWGTGELFLKTKDALEQNNKIILTAYDPSRLAIEESKTPSHR